MPLILMATAAEVPPSMGTTSGEFATKASDGAERLYPARLTTAVVILVIEIAVYRATWLFWAVRGAQFHLPLAKRL